MKICALRLTMGPLPIALGALVLGIPQWALAGEEIERTLEMPADGLVSVENVAGKVEFETWDRAEAEIRGEAGQSVEEVLIEATPNGVQVRVINRKGEQRTDGTDLKLRIPVGASVEAETVSADVSLEGGRGERIILRAVSGDLQVKADPQRVELKTVSGDVEFRGAAKRSNVETVSGEITLAGLAGEVSANTVSGDVTLEAGEVSVGRFEAVSGELTLTLSLSDDGRLACDSMSGDINLSLPSSQQAGFLAQSFSGSLRSDFGESVKVSRGPGVMLEHQVGENAAKVRLQSFSGDISIRRR